MHVVLVHDSEPTSLPCSPAVIAVLAFFALRPRKGWLRRKGAAAADAEADKGFKDSDLVDLSPAGDRLGYRPPAGMLDSYLPLGSQTSQPAAAGSRPRSSAPGSGRDSMPQMASRWVAVCGFAALAQLPCRTECQPKPCPLPLLPSPSAAA